MFFDLLSHDKGFKPTEEPTKLYDISQKDVVALKVSIIGKHHIQNLS